MIFRWVLTVLLMLEVAGTVLNIDVPRDSVTRGYAVFTLILNAVLIYGLFNWL